MHQSKILFILIFVMLFSSGSVGAQTAAEDAGRTNRVEGSVSVGGRTTDIDGSREKFLEYRDLQSGFFIEDFSFKWESATNPAFFDMKVKKPLEEDEFYSIRGGAHGKYRYRFLYDSIPHSYATGKFIFSGFGTSYLAIPDSVQSGLEAVEVTRSERGTGATVSPLVDPTALTDPPGDEARAQAIVNGLYAASDDVTFKVVRKQNRFEYEHDLTTDVKAWLKLKSERRNGAKVISIGTYERFAQTPGFTLIPGNTITSTGTGSIHTGDLFMVSGAELAEPVDYLTTMISVGTGIYKKTWIADLEYTFTDFKNEFSSLRWDNPFRITDATATNASDAPTANAFNRGRFAAGQLALPPDSQSHDLNVLGSVDMPMQGRLSLNIGYGLITQDEAFLPYTLNSAMSGVGGAPADITNPAILPAGDLDGEVKTCAASTVLTFRPAEALFVTAKYRYYDYDDESRHIQFDGYAGFGESFWRTVRNDPGQPVRNEPFTFTKQVADLSLDYHLSRPLTLMVEAGWEGWDFEELRVDGSDEYSVGAGILFKPSRTQSLKIAYKFADKDVEGYKTGASPENPEAKGLINYNWADRERNKVEARYQIMPMEAFTVGLLGRYYKDDYAEDSRFGLKEVKDYSAALDLAYSPSEVLTVYTNYSREYRKDLMQNGAKDDAFDIDPSTIDEAFTADNFNSFNYWNTVIKDTVDTVGVGARFQLIPRKLDLDTGYNFSFGKTRFNTNNPNAAEAQAALGQDVKLANALANDWPDVKNRLHEVRASLTYAVTQNLSASLRYLYEWYKLNDVAWDNMSNYLAGTTAENSTRFVFVNPTYHKYEAQVASVNLAYKF